MSNIAYTRYIAYCRYRPTLLPLEAIHRAFLSIRTRAAVRA